MTRIIASWLAVSIAGTVPATAFAEIKASSFIEYQRPNPSCAASLKTAIRNGGGSSEFCVFAYYDHPIEAGKYPDEIRVSLQDKKLLIGHVVQARLQPEINHRSPKTWKGKGWDALSCDDKDIFASAVIRKIGIDRNVTGSHCEYKFYSEGTYFSSSSVDFQSILVTVAIEQIGSRTRSDRRPAADPTRPGTPLRKVPPVQPVVASTPVPALPPAPDAAQLAEAAALRDANAAQARLAQQQIAAFNADKKAVADGYAAQLAAHRARERARQAEIARINAEAARKQAEWQAAVAACQSGNKAKCAPAETAIAMIEGVVVCPVDATKLFGESTCYGPFQNTLSDHRKASDITLACGSSRTPVRDLGMSGRYHVWGCDYGLNPTKPGSPNIDQAARFALNLPERRSYRCLPKVPGYCRNS